VRRFHDHTRRILVRRIGDFQVQVAVAVIHPGKLQESVPNMKHLELASLARRIEGRLGRNIPAQHVRDRDVGGGNLRQINVLGVRAVIAAGGFRIGAVAQIRLPGDHGTRAVVARAVMPAAAGKLRQGKQSESRAEQGGAKQHLLLHDGRALDVKIKMSQFFTHVQSEMGLWSRPPGNSLS
jgi:hypothetical protein